MSSVTARKSAVLKYTNNNKGEKSRQMITSRDLLNQYVMTFLKISFFANCNIKLSISSVRISLETARCGLGEEGAVGDRRGQAERAGQAAKILSISASKASSGVL